MAAALIPLGIAIVPEIIKLITGLVHKQAPVAEATFGNGTGPVKFDSVLQFVNNALSSAVSSGSLKGPLPAPPDVALIIQSVVQSLLLNGGLTTPPPVPIKPTVTLYPNNGSGSICGTWTSTVINQ